MNPHNPLKTPGAHRVFERLGAADPHTLYAGLPQTSPLAHLGQMIAASAREVDDLHRDLTAHAQLVIERLEPIARGDHSAMRGANGVIQSTKFQVELRVAQRSAARHRLTTALDAYEQCGEPAPPPQGFPEHRRDRNVSPLEAARHRIEGPLAPGAMSEYDPRALLWKALEAVDSGGLRIRQSALFSGDKYTSDGSGNAPAVWASSAERLIADGLLVADTSTSPYKGHLLSLTPAGEAALASARLIAPQLSAALALSATGPAADTAARAERSAALWNGPQGVAREALRAVGSGDLRLHKNYVSGETFISTRTGPRAELLPETVERLIADGLATADTYTSAYRPGQPLSLTAAGKSALEAPHIAEPRVSAALARSTTGPSTDQAPAPAPMAAPLPRSARPPRTR